MESIKQQALEGYLHRVLMDGTKPFRYRSGPHSLLGVPDRTLGKLALSPTLPPVGFKFLNHPFMGEPYIIQPPPNETHYFSLCNDQGSELEGFRERPRENFEKNVSIREKRIEIPGISEICQYNVNVEKELGENRPIIKDITLHNGDMPESKEQNVSDELTEKAPKKSIVIEKGGIEFPSVPEKKKSFPLLSSATKDNTSSDKTETLSSAKKGNTPSSKTENLSQQEVSPAASRQHFVKKRSSKTENNHLPINPTINTCNTSEKLKNKMIVEKRPDLQPLGKQEDHVTRDVGKVRGDVKFAMKREPLSQRGNSSPVSPVGIEKRDKSNHYRVLSASGRIDSGIVNRSSVDTGKRIERIRHAVQELIAKKSAQQTRLYDDTLNQQPYKAPPPPPQQVLIIKQPSNPDTRTPCAFWDRSYLGRFHLKILR